MAIFPGEPVSASTRMSGFIGAKVDGAGGDKWHCKMCNTSVKLSPPTNQQPPFYKPDALHVAQPTGSEH